MPDALELVRELIAVPGPPGQEEAVRAAVAAHAERLGCVHTTDARGNLLIAPPGAAVLPERPDIVVMAHLDEIALLVVGMDYDGLLVVAPLGGAYPWKWGEGPVTILTAGPPRIGRGPARTEPLTGILSFGSIHTTAKSSPAAQAREGALSWDQARIFTGLAPEELIARGVRPGTRVALHPSRRTLTEFGEFVSAPFLDDRADLAALLLALEEFTLDTSDGAIAFGDGETGERPDPDGDSGQPYRQGAGAAGNTLFAATAAEEVGGHGALYLLQTYRPAVAIALEVGPRVPESPFRLDDQPTVWVNDSYSAMQAADIALVARAADAARLSPHWQALSRGGSDASCAASHGLTARPITLAFAAENSHGHEIMHRNSVQNLSRLLLAVLSELTGE